MGKVIVSANFTVDTEIAQDMLSCAGYDSEKRTDQKLVADLLSILECYGVTSTVETITKQNLQSCGCEYCRDLRLIMPASCLGCTGPKEFRDWLMEARKGKKFLFQVEREKFTVIDECPFCHYKFTEEDYDDFEEEKD